MRKIKQQDRPYKIFRYGLVGRTLYDTQVTFAAAQAVVRVRTRAKPKEKIEIYEGSRLLFVFDGGAPCKNKGNTEVHNLDLSCLRCGASQGEACRT